MAGKQRAKSPKAAGPLSKHQLARVEAKAQIFLRATEAAVLEPPYGGEYTERLGLVIAAMVADAATLDNISTLPNMPPLRDMLKWIAQESHPFSRLYYDAKRVLVPLYEERAQAVANRTLRAAKKRKYQAVDRFGEVHDLTEETESDNVERSRLIVDTYQWTLSHLSPRKHGRRAEDGGGGPNEQLKTLFDSLKQEAGE